MSSKIKLPFQDENGFHTLPLPRLSMLERIKLPRFLQKYPRLYTWHKLASRQQLIIVTATGGTVLVSMWLMTIFFFVPKTMHFSFGSTNCTFNPILLPRLTEHEASGDFKLSSNNSLSLLGYPLFSHKTCVQPSQAPEPGKIETLKLSPLNNPLLHKRISVVVEELPKVTLATSLEQPISTSGSLDFALDKVDKIFYYRLFVADKSANCMTVAASIKCDLAPLELAQGATHEFNLERVFAAEEPKTIFSNKLSTLEPVEITASSIAQETTVYDKPTRIKFTTSKTLTGASGITLQPLEPAGEPIQLESSFQDTTLRASFPTELARETLYLVKIGSLTATDGSSQAKPYELKFRTSGGPVVTNSSIGTFKVQTGRNIVLSFDTKLKEGQNFDSFVDVIVGGKAVNTSVSASANTLTINPTSDLPRCTNFSVKLKEGLVSKYDIGGGKSWQINSRTICQVAFSIGRSVRGRSITAYRFGNGSSRIIYVGGMHGNEKSSVATLKAWVDYLERNADKLPANRSIIVIPNHNPDGYASSRRTNMSNVDLNRNFPSNDWATGVYMPGQQFLPNGGGVDPLDQPEASALASYVRSQNPRLVLTYHAVARIVISNDAGDSVGLARQYASDAGYDFSTGASSAGTFEYATTGEFEDWLADKESIPGILVELSSMSRNELGTHRSAMWNLATMP